VWLCSDKWSTLGPNKMKFHATALDNKYMVEKLDVWAMMEYHLFP
jgi:hypothetical protein